MRFVGSSKLTEKGQATIPQEIRDKLGIQPGEEIVFLEENDKVILRRGPLQIREDTDCPECYRKTGEIVKGQIDPKDPYHFSRQYQYTMRRCPKCGTTWVPSWKPLARWHPKDWSTFSWGCPYCRKESDKEVGGKVIETREHGNIIEMDMQCGKEPEKHKWTNILETY